MARREVFTNSLSSGEMAPEYLSRADIAARQEAAKELTNVSIQSGGGIKRRPGTKDLASLSGDTRLLTIGIGASAQLVAFLNGKVQFRDLTGVLLQEVTGAPWTDIDLHVMQVALETDRIVVSANAFPQQLLTKTSGVWTLAAFSYALGAGGVIRQPYYRFPGYDGVTLLPGAYTGSGVSLIASAPLFKSTHVGTRFRYIDVEMQITSVTDTTHATVTIIGSLYPTLNLSVATSAVFLVGQEVKGLDSGTTGIVVNVPTSTSVTVQLTGGYSYFDWTSSTVSEKIVSPTGVTKQGSSAPALNSVPSATVKWDEQLVSAARGYPGSCALHRTRLLNGNFPSPAVNMFVASAIGDITDCDVGTGLDTDAIVELIGRDGSVGIRHFGSTEQLLMLTQSGSLYVPEQVGAPLSPTNLELLKIGPEAAANPVPVLVSEGMLFVEERSGRVMGAIPTGNVRRSWQIADLSELAFHMMGTPVEIGLLAAKSGSDRKVILVKDNGDLAVMSYRRSETVSGWVRWTTSGDWRSAVAANGSLYLVSKRVINGATIYRLEIMDETVYGDGIVQIATPTTPVTQYAMSTVSVWSGATYVGDFAVNGSGVLVGVSDTYTALQVGFDVPIRAELVPPIDGTDGLRHKLRICRVDLEAVASGPIKVNGYTQSGYSQAAGVGGALQLQSGTRRFRTMGRSQTATAVITQDHAGPFEVRSITMEVTS